MKHLIEGRIDSRAARVSTEIETIVAFIGSPLKFSNQYMATLESLISDTRVIRFSDLYSLNEAADVIGYPTLVIIDETLADNLESDEVDLVKYEGTMFAIAFSKIEAAQALFDRREDSAFTKHLSFFPLNSQFEASLAIMRLLLCGQQYLPPEFFETKGTATVTGVSVEHARTVLTPREWEVLNLVSEGKQNKIVAHELNLSEHTVKLHLHHVLSKLKVSNRTEASAWFHANESLI